MDHKILTAIVDSANTEVIQGDFETWLTKRKFPYGPGLLHDFVKEAFRAGWNRGYTTQLKIRSVNTKI